MCKTSVLVRFGHLLLSQVRQGSPQASALRLDEQAQASGLKQAKVTVQPRASYK